MTYKHPATPTGWAVINATDAAAARTAIGVPGLGTQKNVFTGKAEYNPFPFTNPFDSQIFVASLAINPEIMTQGIYIVHRVNGDLHGDAPGGVSDTHDAFATEIFATEATNAKYLNALESSCTVDGPTEILFMTSGLFNGGVTPGSSGTVGEWQVVRVDQIPPIPEGMTIDKLYSLYVKGQLSGEKNYSLYVEGGDSVIAGFIRPPSDNSFCLRLASLEDTDPTQTLLMIQNHDGSRFLFQARADGTVAVGGDVPNATLGVNNLYSPAKVGLDVRVWPEQSANPFQVTKSTGAIVFGVDPAGSTTITNDIKLSKPGQTRIYNSELDSDSIKIGGAAGIELETYTSGFSTRAKLTAAGDFGIGTTSPTAKLHVDGAARATSIELGHASDTTISRVSPGAIAVEGNPIGVRVAVPASASSPGQPGFWATDSTHLYVCTAANTWVRANVSFGTWTT